MESFTPDSNLAKPPLPRRKPIDTSTSKAGSSVPETTDRNEVDSRNISDSRTYDGFARSTVPISETSPQKISKKETREAHPLHPVILELVKPDWEPKVEEILQSLPESMISKENLTTLFKKHVYKSLKKLIEVANANKSRLKSDLLQSKSDEDTSEIIFTFCNKMKDNNMLQLVLKLIDSSEITRLDPHYTLKISTHIIGYSFQKLEEYLNNTTNIRHH